MSGVAAAPPATGTIRVLHVDDEPGLGDLVATFLERTNDRLAVETVASAGEGLDLLADAEFDCVVSDYDMAGRNGIDFLEAIRAEWPDLPFILYTGKGSEEVASEAITAGATDYLQKETGTDHYAVLANRIVNVVERERARSSVDETQRLFSELANSADDVLWLFSHDWEDVVFMSESYEEVYGEPRSTLHDDASAFLDAIHPDDRERVRRAMARLSAGESIDIEYRVNESEEYGRHVWVKADPITDAAGSVTHIGGFTRDVTDRKAREFELASAQRQYEAMFEDPNILAAVLAPDGTVRDVNRTAMEYIDADFDAIVGRPFSETPWWGDDDALERDVEEWVERAAAGEYVPFETEVVSSDGRRVVSGVFRPVTDDEGEVTEIVVSDQDITDRRGRERVLREMYEVIADRDRSFDEQVRALLELGRQQLGVDYGTLSRVRGDEYVFEVVDADGGGIDEGDVVPVSATNCEIAVERRETLAIGDVERDAPEETDRAGFSEWGITCYLGAPVFDDEDVYGTFCFYGSEPRAEGFSEWEVTLVELMSRWVSYELQRQQTNDRLDRFASIVSHDLRNPLNVAQGSIELAEETGDLDRLADARRALDRMTALIDDLLVLARSGVAVDDPSTFDLGATAERSWANVPTGDARLRVETDRTVRADGTRLEQLFENLFRNAVEHGGTGVTVTVGGLDDGFYVADDGAGIPADDREAVFEAGFSTASQGTGFGLSIVREVVDAHGWQVHTTDGPAGGARFEFTGVASGE
ncbi:hybrid sensor histidine kinase/response regulator [Candidatus Halobonum tyrrellensis]|uniref:histidine kinase n=1 Tax=Candidatus Halobonum tyrrellensis G22 TaxID=1324957 RepID=V4GSL1_9EURY|nr:ATP-binding protein [Candidatus Halobonum tyrrellensis]ESP88081.1 multi-sensor signal transduction histidine kinase [Candidatus Halobonum tyrrellensis G22]